MTYKQAKSRARASIRSIIGRDFTEDCDKCGRGIDNGRIEWMGLSFLTLDGRFLCRSCRADETADSLQSLAAGLSGRKIPMSKRLF